MSTKREIEKGIKRGLEGKSEPVSPGREILGSISSENRRAREWGFREGVRERLERETEQPQGESSVGPINLTGKTVLRFGFVALVPMAIAFVVYCVAVVLLAAGALGVFAALIAGKPVMGWVLCLVLGLASGILGLVISFRGPLFLAGLLSPPKE